MRFDTPIYFQTVKAGAYDASTGNYEEDVISEEKQMASVTDTGTETLKLIYGKLKQGSLTIRLQNHYEKPFGRIRVGEKAYNVDRAILFRFKHIFVVSEVQ